MVVSERQQESTVYKENEERIKKKGQLYENPSTQLDKKSSEESGKH